MRIQRTSDTALKGTSLWQSASLLHRPQIWWIELNFPPQFGHADCPAFPFGIAELLRSVGRNTPAMGTSILLSVSPSSSLKCLYTN